MAFRQQSSLKTLSWFRLFFLAIVVYFFYVIAGQQMELMYIRQEARQVNGELEQAAAENKRLIAEKNNLNALTHIEKLAREELGMVKPGEIPYIPSKKQERYTP